MSIKTYCPSVRRLRDDGWMIAITAIVFTTCASFVRAEDEPKKDSTEPVYCLEAGRILTLSDAGELKDAKIVIRGKKIVAVGTDVEVPEGAKRIAMPDCTITPGWIDARGMLGLSPDARRDGASDGSLNVLDGVDPYAEDWRDVITQGITSVYVQPSESGIFGGQGALLRVAPGTTVGELVLKPGASVQAAIGVNPPEGNALQRYGQYQAIKRTLESVKKYKDDWDKYREAKAKFDEEQKKAEGDKKEKKDEAAKDEKDEKKETPSDEKKESEPKEDSTLAAQEPEKKDEKPESKEPEKKDEKASKPEPPKEPKKDLVKEFLVKLLEREIPLRIEAHRPEDVKNAIALADEFKLRLVLEGVSNPGASLETVKGRRIPMVLGPIEELGDTPAYRRGRAESWLTSLVDENARWAIGSFGTRPLDSARLRMQAARAVSHGLDQKEVLRAVTRGAAEILRVEDELGSIEPGKRADLAVFQGDPLDPSSPVCLVMSGGEILHERPESEVQPAAVEPLAKAPALPDAMPSRALLKGGKVPGADGAFQSRDLRIQDGLIEAIGENLEAVEGETVIDLAGAVVSPGLVMPASDLSLGGLTRETQEADTLYMQAAHAYDPTARSVRDLIGDGFLSAAMTPAATNPISGVVGGVQLGSKEPIAKPQLGVLFVLSTASRNAQRYPASLDGQVEVVRTFLDGSAFSSRLLIPDAIQGPLQSDRDQLREGLLNGTLVAWFVVEDGTEVGAALNLIRDYKLRGVLVGPRDLEGHLDAIAETKTGLVISPGDELSELRLLKQVVEASGRKVPVAFTAASGVAARMMAARAIEAGLPRAVALQGLTSQAARMAGLPEPTGTVQEKGAANFVIWSGSPVDLRSRPLLVVVDGKGATSTR